MIEFLLGQLVELADGLARRRRVDAAARVQQLIIVIHQADEAGEGRDLSPLAAEREAAAVESLVMQMGDLADPGFKCLQVVEHLQPVLGVHVEKIQFGTAELPPLLGDLARDPELANVVD
ncbi:hypothetical protein D3C85_1092020 [compost metagenome]